MNYITIFQGFKSVHYIKNYVPLMLEEEKR